MTKFPVTDIYRGTEDNLYSLLERQDGSPEMRSRINTAFQLQSSDIMLLYPSISRFYLFDTSGNLLSKNSTKEYSSTFEFSRDAPWFQETLNAEGQLVILDKTSFPVSLSDAAEGSLFAARAVITLENMEPVGVLLSVIECENISHVFRQQRLYDSERFSICTDTGSVLFGAALSPLSLEDLKYAVRTENGMIHRASGSADDYYHVRYDSENHMYSVIHTPGSSLSPSLVPQFLGILLLLLLAIVAAAFFAFYTFRNVVVSVNSLVGAYTEIGKGNFSFRIPVDTKDEFGYLMESFNTMSASVESLMNEIYTKNLAEKDLEIQMLRNQINPHFLYNTLESMRMLAYSRGFTDFSEMCLLLAKVLRYGVDTTFHITTVSREIENLQDYIRLIEYRFHDSIQITARISPDIYGYSMPKLLLQPLVENAVNHGIGSLSRTGRITVLGFMKDGCLCFQVTDNGSGMSRERLNSLIGYINNENEDFSSIGLKNVHRRIRLFYGEEYGISIESRENYGTSVSIMLPAKKTDSESDTNEMFG